MIIFKPLSFFYSTVILLNFSALCDLYVTASPLRDIAFHLLVTLCVKAVRRHAAAFILLSLLLTCKKKTVCLRWEMSCEWWVVPRCVWSLPCDSQVQCCSAAFWSSRCLIMILLLAPVQSVHISLFNLAHSPTYSFWELFFSAIYIPLLPLISLRFSGDKVMLCNISAVQVSALHDGVAEVTIRSTADINLLG